MKMDRRYKGAVTVTDWALSAFCGLMGVVLILLTIWAGFIEGIDGSVGFIGFLFGAPLGYFGIKSSVRDFWSMVKTYQLADKEKRDKDVMLAVSVILGMIIVVLVIYFGSDIHEFVKREILGIDPEASIDWGDGYYWDSQEDQVKKLPWAD